MLRPSLRLISQSLFCLALASCSDEQERPSRVVIFEDVAQEAGLGFVHHNGFAGDYFYVETFGSGAAFLDYDDDGWLDVYLIDGSVLTGPEIDPTPSNKLYRNEGAVRFVDVSAEVGAADSGYGMGVAVADYDNDGDQDLFVTNFGPDRLYRNESGISFSEVTSETGLGDPRWGTSTGFLDYDNDGDLDLFVTAYVEFSLARNVSCKKGKVRSYCEPETYEPERDILYRNDGDGAGTVTFADVTDETGVNLLGRGLGVAFSDYDTDGDTDIYVANDGTMNFLYENRRGSFVEVGLQVGARYNAEGRAEAGMGVDFGDYDNDGDQDLFVTNFTYETNTLYANDSAGQFLDVTTRAGLTEPSFGPLGFGVRFFDYDNDSDLDLFVANGHVMDRIAEVFEEISYRQPNQILGNEGHTFSDHSSRLGPALAVADASRGAAVADYDNDGDLDLLVTNEAGRPNLLRNEGGNQGNWLLVGLVGAVAPDAIGARVEVVAGNSLQIRERQSGGSYLSASDPRLHFGLGSAQQVDVIVRWPDGSSQEVRSVSVNQILTITQSID